MKSVLILGYGSTGQDIEKYLISKKIKYFIHDDNEFVPSKLKFQIGELSNLETIYISPGINHDHDILKLASSNNIKVTNDIELFNELDEIKLIGVTGTNGKTSFITLLNKILNQHDYRSNVAGNIGSSPLNLLSDTGNYDYLILELSSFQLTHINNLKLDTSIILNIHEDHIDWHGSFKDYAKSKLKIFNFTQNEDKKFIGSVDNEIINQNLIPNNVTHVNEDELFNLENYFDDFVSMFIQVCNNFSITKDDVLDFLSSEVAVEHRFERFHTVNDVKFINDSKSTNLESVNKASFKVRDSLLVMHGLSKGIDSNKLLISNEVKTILIPKNSEFNVSKYKDIVVEYENLKEMESFIISNYKKYRTVLFSCGGSSFSDFKNYIARGKYFKEMVQAKIK